MRRIALILTALTAATVLATGASAQVFYPAPTAVLPAPLVAHAPGYGLSDDGLDVTLEMEAFTTNWGEGYSGLSYGAGVDVDLSPNLVLELDASRLETTMGNAYEYGAGLNLHGDRGELYAAINGLTVSPDNFNDHDMTWVEVGGKVQLTNRLTLGFEASTSIDRAVVPYESIYSPNALNQYR